MNQKFVKELSEIIVKIKNRKLAENFLSNILTPAELDEISRRLQIVKMLKKGMPQRKIAKNLNVAIATVGRGSKELKYGKAGFKNVI
ncbi:helix-turn-helix domain-containing protein [Candidatus Peregrinibacteria bacterium]|nr:helix-turn-helix domain-containing protein [Candidatus Peregrinibacteria bacterium]